MSGMKRMADTRPSRDDDDDRYDERVSEEFVTTPQIADAEELAKRRMVSVKRTVASAASPAAGSGGISGSGGGGFFGGVTTSIAPPTTGFSFGVGAKKDEAPKLPPSTFGFGSSGTPGDKKEGGSTPAPSGFGFGAPPASEAPKFSFGFPAAAPASASAAPVSFGFGSKGSDAAAKPEPGKFTFGSSVKYNFSEGVSSFAEAQRKLMEENKANVASDSAPAKVDGDGEGKDTGEDTDVPNPLSGASSIVTLSGEVLASGPSKLYVFDKEGAKWKEHGEGDAKVKKDVVPTEDGGEAKKGGKTVYRLMVRDGYSLNAVVSKKGFVLSKESEKHFVFSIAVEGGVETYLLKFTGTSAETTAKKVMEEVKKAINAAE